MEHPQISVIQPGRTIGKGRSALRFLVTSFLFICVTCTTAQAESVDDQLREMRQAIQDLQQQVKTLRDQLRETQGALARTQPIRPASAVETSISPQTEAQGGSASPNLAKKATPSGQTEESPAQQPPDVGKIPMLESEIADLAQVKVESNSRFPVKIFGTIVSDAAFNSAGVNWLDNPMVPVATTTGGLRRRLSA
jgi:hypothetical protein